MSYIKNDNDIDVQRIKDNLENLNNSIGDHSNNLIESLLDALSALQNRIEDLENKYTELSREMINGRQD